MFAFVGKNRCASRSEVVWIAESKAGVAPALAMVILGLANSIGTTLRDFTDGYAFSESEVVADTHFIRFAVQVVVAHVAGAANSDI